MGGRSSLTGSAAAPANGGRARRAHRGPLRGGERLVPRRSLALLELKCLSMAIDQTRRAEPLARFETDQTALEALYGTADSYPAAFDTTL